MKNIITKSLFVGLIITSSTFSCTPYEKEGIDLPEAPSASFSWDYLPGDENRVVFQSNSEDSFIHFWNFGNGQTSTQTTDTIFYPQAGEYEVTYSVSNAGGMGTAKDDINIDLTVELPCEGTLALLTGCAEGKTWKLSQVAGAISVGPDPYSVEWYASPASGLVPEQYADEYQFSEAGGFSYLNYGCTINPWEGYICNALEVPTDLTYLLNPGTGTSGEDQIILQNCWFMGVWDSGPLYDIVELTETSLIIHGAVQTGECSTGEGFFTLSFVAQ